MRIFNLVVIILILGLVACNQGGKEERIKKSSHAAGHDEHEHEQKRNDANAVPVSLPDCEEVTGIKLVDDLDKEHEHEEAADPDLKPASDGKKVDKKCKKSTDEKEEHDDHVKADEHEEADEHAEHTEHE